MASWAFLQTGDRLCGFLGVSADWGSSLWFLGVSVEWGSSLWRMRTDQAEANIVMYDRFDIRQSEYSVFLVDIKVKI